MARHTRDLGALSRICFSMRSVVVMLIVVLLVGSRPMRNPSVAYWTVATRHASVKFDEETQDQIVTNSIKHRHRRAPPSCFLVERRAAMTVAPATPIATGAPATGVWEFLTQILSDRDRFFSEVAEGQGLRSKLVYSLWTLVGLSALYGAAAGAYAGPVQALSSAVKLPFLFLGTLAI